MALGAKVAVEELERRGFDPELTLEKAGLTRALVETDSARIPYDKYAEFLERAAADSNDTMFGLNVSRKIDPHDLGVLSYVSLASDTLSEALANFERYSQLVTQAYSVELSSEADNAVLTIVSAFPVPINNRQMAEATAGFFFRFCQYLTGRDITPVEIRFAHPFAGNDERHRAFFGCPVLFGQPYSQALFRIRDMEARIDTADDRLKRILNAHCDVLMEKSAPFTPELVSSVQQHIADLLPKHKAKARIVAARMGLSERSLSRRLKDHDTNFGLIKDQMRQDLAYQYLRESGESLANIAFLLDYSTQSAFSASFKRMTGHTPKQVRRSS